MAEVSAKSFPEIGKELWEMSVAYAKQETVDPLKGLGKYLAFGLGGSFLIGLGLIMLVLAGLRALQTETGSTFTGNLSWIPYLILLLIGVLVLAVVGKAITKKGS